MPFDLKSLDIVSTSFMTFDLNDNLLFLSNKNSIYLFKMLNTRLKEDELNNELQEIDVFSSVANVTTIELWHSMYSCLLLAGSSNGKIHLFKLLNN